MDKQNMELYYRSVVLNLEQATKGNRFKSKEELNNYIKGMKQRGIPETILSEEEILKLLNLYDEYHQKEETALDMQNHKGISLGEQNYVVSTKADTVLKTDTPSGDMAKEFKQTQNEITAASTQDGLANANTVYENLRNNKKEEVSLIPIFEAIERNNISEELLSKIKFFITSKYINPYSYKISPESGIFYNTETDEILEVRKNEQTGKYEIIKGGEVVYKEESQTEELSADIMPVDEQSEDRQELVTDTNEELMTYQNGLSQPKVRKRVPPKQGLDQAAFVKSAFILIAIVVLSIALASVIIIFR